MPEISLNPSTLVKPFNALLGKFRGAKKHTSSSVKAPQGAAFKTSQGSTSTIQPKAARLKKDPQEVEDELILSDIINLHRGVHEFKATRLGNHNFYDIRRKIARKEPDVGPLMNLSITELFILTSKLPYVKPDTILSNGFTYQVEKENPQVQSIMTGAIKSKELSAKDLCNAIHAMQNYSSLPWLVEAARESESKEVREMTAFFRKFSAKRNRYKAVFTVFPLPIIYSLLNESEEVLETFFCLSRDGQREKGILELSEMEGLLETSRALAG